MKPIGKIAVDLTPILPGGENGGAKIFVIELIRRLAEMAPQTQFLLLTQAASHQELATLDSANIKRMLVVGPGRSSLARPWLTALASHVVARVPGRLRGLAARLGYKLYSSFKRRGSSSLLRDNGVDLLFCPFTAPTYAEPEIATVCTIYDLQYKTYPEFFAPEDVAHRHHTFVDACRRATALTAISDYSRDSAIRHGDLGESRIRTIHLRMAQRIAPTSRQDTDGILERYGLTRQQYFIYPANFWKHKNHEMLLTAFCVACRDGLPDGICLICTGAPGARQDWLRAAASAMGLGDLVQFPGYLSNEELGVLMGNSLGVLFPSLYEGFGLPVIEAMAAGVPVACSSMTSLPEVAGDAAILFDPRNPKELARAICSLAKDAALRERLVAKGRQRAAEFADSTRMAGEYWDLFDHAIAHVRHENLLTGVYADGWAGPSLNIQVAPGPGEQRLEIEFFAPEWLPQSRITAHARLGGSTHGAPVVLGRGTSAVLSLPVQPIGGCYEVRMAPTFVPIQSGHGNDQRELSALLRRCGVVDSQGNYVELFADRVPE